MQRTDFQCSISQILPHQQTAGAHQKGTQITHSLSWCQRNQQCCFKWQYVRRGPHKECLRLIWKGHENKRQRPPKGSGIYYRTFPTTPLQEGMTKKQTLSKPLMRIRDRKCINLNTMSQTPFEYQLKRVQSWPDTTPLPPYHLFTVCKDGLCLWIMGRPHNICNDRCLSLTVEKHR